MIRPTIADIARRAGVNPSTVSRILNNKPDFPLKADLKKKVWKIASTMNYQPSFSARSLALGKTYSIGVVLGRIESGMASPFLASLLTALMRTVMKAGYTLSILPVDETRNLDEEMLRTMRQGRMDGYFIMNGILGPKALKDLAKLNIPAVAFDLANELIPSATTSIVRVDEDAGALELVKTLINYGHKKIAYFRNKSPCTELRYCAFKSAVKKLGVGFTNSDCISFTRNFHGFLTDREEARAVAEKKKNKLKQYSVIVCSSDLTALGVRDILNPDFTNQNAISIVGYDNLEDTPFYNKPEPCLATIDPQRKETGQQTGQILLKYLQGKNHKPEMCLVPTKFINKKSLLNLNHQ